MKSIPGHEGYFVTSEGEVFSSRVGEIKQLAILKTRNGYIRVGLQVNNKPKMFSVHYLVLLTFYGPPQEGQICRHLNGIKSDNHIDNLRWGTHSENELDKQKHGTVLIGACHPRGSQLTNSEVIRIRELYYYGYSAKSIGTLFAVSTTVVSNICRGVSWKHVGGPIHTKGRRGRGVTVIPPHIRLQVEKKK
jgi:hypothetical protein